MQQKQILVQAHSTCGKVFKTGLYRGNFYAEVQNFLCTIMKCYSFCEQSPTVQSVKFHTWNPYRDTLLWGHFKIVTSCQKLWPWKAGAVTKSFMKTEKYCGISSNADLYNCKKRTMLQTSLITKSRCDIFKP